MISYAQMTQLKMLESFPIFASSIYILLPFPDGQVLLAVFLYVNIYINVNIARYYYFQELFQPWERMLYLLRSLPGLLIIFTHLFSHVFAASGNEPTGPDAVVSIGNDPTCQAIPSSITSGQDFRAKTRATSAVCSIHEGFFHLFARDTVQDYSCSETKPCSNGACCAKTGYCNYGPEACGTDGKSPNDKCWSNCDAHAPCGKNSLSGDLKCPLNVCCSQFGFCGATSDFCGKGMWLNPYPLLQVVF